MNYYHLGSIKSPVYKIAQESMSQFQNSSDSQLVIEQAFFKTLSIFIKIIQQHFDVTFDHPSIYYNSSQSVAEKIFIFNFMRNLNALRSFIYIRYRFSFFGRNFHKLQLHNWQLINCILIKHTAATESQSICFLFQLKLIFVAFSFAALLRALITVDAGLLILDEFAANTNCR